MKDGGHGWVKPNWPKIKITPIVTHCLKIEVLQRPHYLIKHFCTQSIFFLSDITRALSIAEYWTGFIYVSI